MISIQFLSLDSYCVTVHIILFFVCLWQGVQLATSVPVTVVGPCQAWPEEIQLALYQDSLNLPSPTKNVLSLFSNISVAMHCHDIW